MSVKNCVTHSYACDCREAIFKEKEQKLDRALQLLRELDADFDTQEHSYVGRGSDFHKRIKSILKEQ